MAFPQEFIDQVKEANGLVELVQEYTDLKKAGIKIYMGHCPHPDHHDSTPSFRVYEKGYKSGTNVNEFDSWACMGCHNGKKNENDKKYRNFGSDCIAFIQWIEPKYRNWKDALLYLARRKHIPIPTQENEWMYKQKKIIARSLMYNLYGEPFKYLEDRGLTIEDCDEWMIGFDGEKITFPLFDRYKNVLGFTRRWLHVPEGANDKYKNSSNSKIFNKSNYFYGIHNLDTDFDEIRITEGSMDVILAHKYGVKNVVASLGTAFTQGHVDLIKHYKKIPVFCLDGDDAGSKAVNKAISLLAANGIYSKILILPKDKDLADMSLELKDGIEEYIQKHSITYGVYLLNSIVGEYNSKVNELKLQMLPDMRGLLNFVPSEDEKLILKGFIRNSMGIDI